MLRRYVPRTDWVLHAQWLCHRLAAIDGRLRIPHPQEVTDLGHTLSLLRPAADGVMSSTDPAQLKWIGKWLERLGVRRAHWAREPHDKALPMVGLHPVHGLCLVTEPKAAQSPWVLETPLGRKNGASSDSNWMFCSLALGWREQLQRGGLGLAKRVLLRHRGPFLWLLLLTLGVNSAIATLAWWLNQRFEQPMVGIDLQALSLLGLGGVISFGLIHLKEFLRHTISTRVAENLDTDLARETFERLLQVRADPHAPHPESLTTQLQLFESVRSFAHMALTLALLDIPFALLFWFLIQTMVGLELGSVAAGYVLLKLVQAVFLCWKVRQGHAGGLASNQNPVSLMMKTIECAETVKSLDLRSVFLQRWSVATREQLKHNRGVQHLTEIALNGKNGLRQLGFIVWLWVSVDLIAQGLGPTVGAWVGATLLLPRVLYPAASLPALCVQWLQARLALRSIDQIFKLQVDANEPPQKRCCEPRQSQLTLESVRYVHPKQLDDLRIGHWLVKPGERVGIVGDLGGGKSTLLKLMAGLYKPQQGHVHIDQIDVEDLPRELLSLKVAYLPQNVQIFSGTLRENLLAGLTGVDDAQLLDVCQRVGLMAFVNAHVQGLSMPLQEGPHGLSVGQRQLIGLARLLLRDPLIWLLDNPLANLDDGLQQRVLGVLKQSIRANQTLIVVGHQPALLAWVNRVTVLCAGRLLLDGPRDRVLAQWRSKPVLNPIENHTP